MPVPCLGLFVLVASVPLRACVRVSKELFAEDFVQSLQNIQESSKQNTGSTSSTGSATCPDQCDSCGLVGGRCDPGGCAPGFGLTSSGQCDNCTDHCDLCNETGAGACDAGGCASGYGPSTNGLCEPCTENCTACEGSLDKCDHGRCVYTYGPNSEGKCEPCPENCFYCNEGADKCDPGQCYHGTTQDEVTGLCKKNCEYKFGRNSTGDCVPCPENCFYCNEGADKCDPGQCYNGYAQHPITGLCHKSCDYKTGRNPDSFECEPCPKNCFYCDNGPSQCDKGQCYTGYAQHPVTGLCHERCDYLKGRNPESFECEPCPENCFFCNDGPRECDMGQCHHGYWRNSSGLCEKYAAKRQTKHLRGMKAMPVPCLGLFVLVASIPLRACVRVSEELFAEDFVQSLQNIQENSKQNTGSTSSTRSATCPDQCDSCSLVGGRCDPGGCAPGFGLTSSGQCDNCTDHCDLCNETGAGACDAGGCASGYGPSTNGLCEPCTENCTACEGSLDKCDHGRCVYKYGPNSEGKCEPCPENCFFCNEGADKCDDGQCYLGSAQHPITGLCHESCAYKTGRNPDSFECEPCPENCFYCDKGPSQCDKGQCYNGWVQHPVTGLCHKNCDYQMGRNPDSFECEPCPENCFYCNDGPSKCDRGQCYTGYKQNPITGLCHKGCDYRKGRNPDSFECEPCPENCFYCDYGPSQCDIGQCYHGYWRNSSGLCEKNM